MKIKKSFKCKSEVGNHPWVNSELLLLIKKRNNFYRLWRKYRDDEYVKNKFRNLKKQANVLNNNLKKKIF